MEKPATILIKEFKESIVETINNSNLPMWKIKDELEFFIMPQVKNLAEREEQIELEEYNNAQKEEEKEKLEELREKRVSTSKTSKKRTKKGA